MTGVPASPSGHSASPEPKVSALRANVPNAEALIALMSAWSCMPKHKFDRAYPFFEADRQRTIEEYDLFRDDRAKLEATALLFAEYADELYASGMEARRAATAQTGAVHDGPVDESETPNPDSNVRRSM